MNWNKVNISASFSPHPLDEDSFLEIDCISWLPGFVNPPEDPDGEDPLLLAENIALYKKTESYVERQFRKALKNTWPLLRGYHFQRLNILIDVTGIDNHKNTAAGYLYAQSRPGKGVYYFKIQPNLLYRYLKGSRKSKSRLKNEYIWEHELVHLLDHPELLRASVYFDSDDPAENLKYYILKFREEGIAELFNLLNGNHPRIHSVEEAKTQFMKKVLEVKEECLSLDKSTSVFRDKIYEGQVFYDAGPWLILDILQKMGIDCFDNILQETMPLITKGIPAPGEKVLKIIELAFMIDVRNFLAYARDILGD